MVPYNILVLKSMYTCISLPGDCNLISKNYGVQLDFKSFSLSCISPLNFTLKSYSNFSCESINMLSIFYIYIIILLHLVLVHIVTKDVVLLQPRFHDCHVDDIQVHHMYIVYIVLILYMYDFLTTFEHRW